MASIIYNSLMRNIVEGVVQFDADTFKVMLVTSAYVPSKAHDFRNDVTNEVVGTGYVAGGEATPVAITPGVNVLDLEFDPVVWETSTITARGAVIYKDTGSSATDNLVAFVDFLTDQSSVAGDFNLSFSSPLRIDNS